jgi:phosphatidylserine/phosphatidylglycerophosphate/cardiolipin synthase-like enzyme
MRRSPPRGLALARLALAGLGVACGAPLDARTAPVAAPVRVLVEPDVGADAVRGLLAAARRSLSMEMYLLTDGPTIDTLVARRRAGVDVRVVLEPHPYEADGANDGAFSRLAAAGIEVAWASPRFALTHAKVAVVDRARLVVLTLNLTRAGLAGNREYAVVDDDARDVAAADALIAGDLAGLAPAAPGGRVLASPTSTRPALAAALARAARTVAVQMEELSDGALVRALLAARARGCAVSVALPGGGASPATTGAAGSLASAGVVVRFVDAPQIHAKAVVADDWLYLGSANLTAASLDANREVGLGLTDPAALRLVAATIADDLARGRPP